MVETASRFLEMEEDHGLDARHQVEEAMSGFIYFRIAAATSYLEH